MNTEKLNKQQAERLLRRVLQEGEARRGEAPAPTAETRQVLVESLEALNRDTIVEFNTSSQEADDVAKLSLAVFANDPVYRHLLNDERPPAREPSKDFGVDPISFLSATSLALVVLSTYINIKRDAKGHWTFQFKITASSEKLKIELIKLAKALISALPKE